MCLVHIFFYTPNMCACCEHHWNVSSADFCLKDDESKVSKTTWLKKLWSDVMSISYRVRNMPKKAYFFLSSLWGRPMKNRNLSIAYIDFDFEEWKTITVQHSCFFLEGCCTYHHTFLFAPLYIYMFQIEISFGNRFNAAFLFCTGWPMAYCDFLLWMEIEKAFNKMDLFSTAQVLQKMPKEPRLVALKVRS